MKIKNAKTLPKIGDRITNGGVYRQKVRCGKAACKCSRGEPHFAHYFFIRLNGKLSKYYIRKADVDHFSNWVKRSVERRQRDRHVLKTDAKIYRDFHLTLAEYSNLIYKGGLQNGI